MTQKEIQDKIINMRNQGSKWQDIQTQVYPMIPTGTLYKIMHTGIVPKKWWRVLKIKAVRQPRIAISKVDMDKAAYSIIKNISYKKVIELTESLVIFVMEQKKP